MKVVGKEQESIPKTPQVLKFKLKDEVKVVGPGFCQGATGYVVDFYEDRNRYEVWIEIGKNIKAIFMLESDLEKVSTKEESV